MAMKYVFIFLLLSCRLFGATCISTGNGIWSNTSTWSCGQVPTCGDSIIIQAGHTITVNTQLNYSSCGTPLQLMIKGTLYFITGKKLSLPCGSYVYIITGGLLDSDGSGNSNLLVICNTTYWSGNMGPIFGPACIPANAPNCSTALPVELINFSSHQSGTKIIIDWSTATERNNNRFSIERSGDGLSWNEISSVNSQTDNGNSNTKLHYVLYDNNPLRDLNYYRLIQIDHDGYSVISKIIVQSYQYEDAYVIYPNPATNELTIRKACDISIINNVGIVVFKQSYNDAQQINLVLPIGLYLCQTTTLAGFTQFKLIIK